MSDYLEAQLLLSRPYLTKNQVTRAQKNTISDRRIYNQKKLTVFKLLTDTCAQLRLPRKTLETALYYYQRYHLFNPFETELCYTLATSCLILSCKQVETLKKVNDICTTSLKLRNITKLNQEYLENFKKRIFQIELRILESCNFDYRINNAVHIDEYVIKFCKSLEFESDIAELAWIIAYDALKLETLLIVPQHSIALASLKIAFELLGLTNWPIKKIETFGIDLMAVNEAYFDIINFYINAFDLCDLKDNLPQKSSIMVSIDAFLELKKKAGPEVGLIEIPSSEIDADPFISSPRDFAIMERRYVLSQKVLANEAFELNRSRDSAA
ncbi:hypothetical protein KAFR_0J01080 [Kazachstania africana CBS 2517]|uniref:Cyclin-like domain-containing protein n=1 Tax=Kazachstania africana (strain ATCC 22294 / BCRC 22015 / CBS 2517 / CECT 1963 / NBRC 1671 / NRRL Y-8276) TaxID=1071382 RepID=H2B0M5_KAZAF|nr:hypothetical protein KAFR_0J01080 [Kazachstania africana CBS 2517]CCF60175.1 hypothetical protein KAFR_0J01080 [Kazachstania africana CBS 2517]